MAYGNLYGAGQHAVLLAHGAVSEAEFNSRAMGMGMG